MNAQAAYEIQTEHLYGESEQHGELVDQLAADLLYEGATLEPTKWENVYQSLEDLTDTKINALTAAMREGDWCEVGRILSDHSESYWTDVATELVEQGLRIGGAE